MLSSISNDNTSSNPENGSEEDSRKSKISVPLVSISLTNSQLLPKEIQENDSVRSKRSRSAAPSILHRDFLSPKDCSDTIQRSVSGPDVIPYKTLVFSEVKKPKQKITNAEDAKEILGEKINFYIKKLLKFEDQKYLADLKRKLIETQDKAAMEKLLIEATPEIESRLNAKLDNGHGTEAALYIDIFNKMKKKVLGFIDECIELKIPGYQAENMPKNDHAIIRRRRRSRTH